MFYSLTTLVHKVASSIAVPLALLLLKATNYVPNAARQPDSALLGIRIIIGPIPALLLLLGIIFAFLYPLNRQQYAQICCDLKNRRAAISEESV